MTSPEWEAANEDDSDRFPQTSHASASESTESHEQGSQVVPDPERVARYAEASTLTIEVIAAMWRGHTDCTWVSTGHDVVWSCGIIHPRPIHMQPTTRDRHFAALLKTQIDADMAVADEERAALVAEVERLREDLRIEVGLHEEMTSRWRDNEAALLRVRALGDALADDGSMRHGGNIAWHIEEAIANEKGDFPDAADRRIASQRERAEAAEAKVAKVEALADELDQTIIREQPFADRYAGYYAGVVSAKQKVRDDLRAALADAPAEQRAEGGDSATEGSGCYVASFSEDTCGEHGGEWVYEDDGTTVLPECSRAEEFRTVAEGDGRG